MKLQILNYYDALYKKGENLSNNISSTIPK